MVQCVGRRTGLGRWSPLFVNGARLCIRSTHDPNRCDRVDAHIPAGEYASRATKSSLNLLRPFLAFYTHVVRKKFD